MHSPKRKICVVTGTRAEYGLLYWLLREIEEDPHLELQIIATGMHLSPEFGLTYQVIENDGFIINEKVEMLLSSDTPTGIAKSMGLGIIGVSGALDRLKPDIMVVLGDRYEILAAVQSALVARVPVAHLHGGESTEGAFDEAIRHSITKMSHLHFVSTERYRQRVIQLGEDPGRVYNYGAPGLDNISRLNLLDREQFEKETGFRLGKLNFLVTYHPVTLKEGTSHKSMEDLLKALDHFKEARIIFTLPNSDTEGRGIIKLIEEYTGRDPGRASHYTSLGQLKYLSAIQQVDAVIGNSSSGLYEVPVFKKPTVNIGERQAGRQKAGSVIDCEEHAESIIQAIEKALSPGFQALLPETTSPYYVDGYSSRKIKELLKRVDLKHIILKKFYDLEVKT